MKKKPLRIKGEVPADYTGRVYYRIVQDVFVSYSKSLWNLRADKKRFNVLYDDRNRDRHILTSGLVVDEVGQLLPQWHIPLKARLLTDKPLPYEFSSIVSERIYDAIVSLEPHAHIFIPIDATRPDERVERHYFMFMGDAFFWDSPPILHPEKNALEIIQYSNGTNGYADAPWVSSFSSDRYHFGYLNSQAIEGRHLFASSMLGNERVFSDVLIDKLREFGDIFDKSRELVSIGVA